MSTNEIYSLIDDDNELCSSLKIEEDHYFPIEEFSELKVLYLCNFSTEEGKRNRGYGRQLLLDVISRVIREYDIVYLTVKPYHFDCEGNYVDAPPSDGLSTEQLIEFYKSCGFRVFDYKENPHENTIPMVLKLK